MKKQTGNVRTQDSRAINGVWFGDIDAFRKWDLPMICLCSTYALPEGRGIYSRILRDMRVEGVTHEDVVGLTLLFTEGAKEVE